MDDLRVQVEVVRPGDADTGLLIRAQMRELMETWHRRVVSEAELDAELGPQPAEGLAVLALARRGGEAVGCGGLRVLGNVGELTKVYVVPPARGTGVGEAVVSRVEQAARDLGLRLIRLDTRVDLPAPANLYRRLGYRRVAPWHEGPYAHFFFSKDL